MNANIIDPLVLFHEWLQQARACDLLEPTAMSLATVDADGWPSNRMVLLKEFDQRGFVFYTNTASAKARDLLANNKTALGFHWDPLRRQVRISGVSEAVTDAEADLYFATRSRMSQIGAWASRQSEVMTDSYALEKRIARYTAKFAVGKVPRPEFWSGYRVAPRQIEFWENRNFRLHERRCFVRVGDGWRIDKLYP
jgi:pyridoxamine 5'-phosphate oxidase